MRFDPKAYLYYTSIKDVLEKNEWKADKMIELLGNFNVTPGSLKVHKEPKSYGKELTCDSFKAENKNMITSSFKIDNYGNIIIDGYLNNNYIKITIKEYDIEDYKEDKDSCELDLVIDNPNNGIYYYTSKMFYAGFRSDKMYQPFYAYYDVESLNLLSTEYNLSGKDIIQLTPHKLSEIGIEPDKFTFTSSKDLGYKNHKEFAHNLLTSLSDKELEEKLENIPINEEKNQTHFGHNSYHKALSYTK